MDSNKDFFETLQKILMQCWLFGFAVLFVWFAATLSISNMIFGIHSSMFSLSRHEFDLINYCGMGLWKLFVIACFFLPWLSINTLRKSNEI